MTKLSRDAKVGLLYVVIAVFFFSTSPIFIRWADSVSSYELTFWRLTTAALTVGVMMLIKRERWHTPLDDWRKFALFGLITALHFLFYIASLYFTTIAHSLAIVYTAPVFVTLFSAFFLKEHIPKRKWGGIVITVIGIAILAGFQPNFTKRMLFGDILALGSAITFGFYSVAGRSQRHHYSLFTYAITTYGAAALWAFPAAAFTFTSDGYTAKTIFSILGMGVFPLGFGHTLYNAALRRVHASYANVIATQEVTGGVVLGALLLGEIPGVNEIVGVIVALLGILIVIL